MEQKLAKTNEDPFKEELQNDNNEEFNNEPYLVHPGILILHNKWLQNLLSMRAVF